ncbi:hypothetical protein KC727_02230 [Candidatus Kaiserbacteria bacterium]|nr:hypothetical protein [Candidatus Kaiserbacteria bacterium]
MCQGYVTLISVLIVGAVGVAVTLSLVLLGLSSSQTSFASEQSDQAKGLANACAEEGLQRIRDNTAYTGTGNLSLGQGACTYTVTSHGSENRTIRTVGIVGTIVREVEITINSIEPDIQIVSWQEGISF